MKLSISQSLPAVLMSLTLWALPNLAYSMVPPCFQYVLEGDMKIDVVNPEAGFEYPTETPPFPGLDPYKVLKIGEGTRILVNNTALLNCGYFSEGSLTVYLPKAIERAVAGVDYPTDGPADLERDFVVWVLDSGVRIRLNSIHKIVSAVAGIDFPSDGPASLPRDFHVMVLFDGTRIALRH